MFENEDDILFQEILRCQTNEDIQHLVYSQCLDIIGNSVQDQLSLSHKQLFRVIRLFKEYINQKPTQLQDQRKSRQQALLQHQQNCILLQYQLQLEQNKVSQLHLDNEMMKLQLKIYQGDLETLKQQNFEDIKKIENQLFNTLKQISLYKDSLIQKICVICMQKEYNMIMKPCGHICVCEYCSKYIDQCPIDKEKITKIKKVYLS
ncbi:unnamed protein product [Paramecium primaurelia]|uniref:RING-type domain-containing protein n=1 Tax=Paramecium primaurelia TaxID=5886 RepID=A0A8S1KWR3_PARPR|nr:unnamed protein product [Paramecium primaurelia]